MCQQQLWLNVLGRSPVQFSGTWFIWDFFTFGSGNKLSISANVKFRFTLLTAETLLWTNSRAKAEVPSTRLLFIYIFIIMIEFLRQTCPGCNPACGPMTPGIGSSKTPATVSAGERGGNFCTDMKEMPDGEKSFDELAKSKKSLAFKSIKTEMLLFWGWGSSPPVRWWPARAKKTAVNIIV